MKNTLAETSMKGINYVIWSARPGGVELSIKHYIEHFSGSRAVKVFSLRPVENTLYDEEKISYHTGHNGNFSCYRAYYRYCRKNRDQIFHLLNVGPVVLFLTLLAGVKKPVYHIHGTIHWKSSLKKAYLKFFWLINSLFEVTYIAISRHSASIFHHQVLPVDPRVIYNGFEVEKFWKKRALRTQLRRMAYVGRLQTGKNIDMVIRLFEEIAADCPGLELHLAGDGPLRRPLEEQAGRSPYRDRIKFLGYLEDISAFYASVDLMVFLSAYESFGNVLAEALLTGLPILTSNIPVFKEIYGGEDDFVLGSPDHYDLVKRRFLEAVSDFPALAGKAMTAGDRIRDSFSYRTHLDNIGSLYAGR